jgi:hypothetical protein
VCVTNRRPTADFASGAIRLVQKRSTENDSVGNPATIGSPRRSKVSTIVSSSWYSRLQQQVGQMRGCACDLRSVRSLVTSLVGFSQAVNKAAHYHANMLLCAILKFRCLIDFSLGVQSSLARNLVGPVM